MKREEQLIFCKRCVNRQIHDQHGLVCVINGHKTCFESECADFRLDGALAFDDFESQASFISREENQVLSSEVVDKLRLEQRLFPAIILGLIVGLLGAVLWGGITVATQFQIGYIAIAIGAGVGWTVRRFGKGIDPIFAYCGAIIALLSVLLGNILSIIGFIANAEELAYIETLLLFDYSYMPAIMKESFNPMDLIFYGIAIYEGYQFSFRKITEDDLARVR
jgi:hypothetical protein